MTSLRQAEGPRGLVWFDGELLPIEHSQIAPLTHALHYGSGVFEGIRAYETSRGTAIFRLHDHLERLFASAAAYGLLIPYSIDQLTLAIRETLAANSFRSGYIRPLVFFGAHGISLAPRYTCPTHVLIVLKELDGSHIDATAARVTISPWQKTPSQSLPSTVKACGHYTNSILALHDAYERGFDEAILLNSKGLVAEGSAENIFVVSDRQLITNDASQDILEGITRDTILTIARELEIPVAVRLIDVHDLYCADELFFTGTAAEVLPIAEIDGRLLPAPGPTTSLLRDAYSRIVRGYDERHVDWLSQLFLGDDLSTPTRSVFPT